VRRCRTSDPDLRHGPDREIAKCQPFGNLHLFQSFVEFDQFTATEFEDVLIRLVLRSHFVIEIRRSGLLDVASQDMGNNLSAAHRFRQVPALGCRKKNIASKTIAITPEIFVIRLKRCVRVCRRGQVQKKTQRRETSSSAYHDCLSTNAFLLLHGRRSGVMYAKTLCSHLTRRPKVCRHSSFKIRCSFRRPSIAGG
jgi:hypothetical protein